MQKVVFLRDIAQYQAYLEAEVVDYIADGQIQTFESFPEFDIIAFDWYDIGGRASELVQMMVYIDADDIFVLCENDAAYNKAQSVFHEESTNERAMYKFFLGLLRDDAKHLEMLEDDVTQTEDEIITGSGKDCRGKIVRLRRELLQLKKYYEQLDDIFCALEENDNDLITPDCLKYFVILGSRTDRLMKNVLTLRDYITQVREAYQAQIDIEQNKLMKIFTIMTSVFLPLTLIVGWYGMNFDMPELEWRYGYAMVIVLSVVVCGLCMWVFKRKKWL